MNKEMRIRLLQHGESLANIGQVQPHLEGDYRIPLSDRGRQQIQTTAQKFTADELRESLIYCSPYHRTRETLSMLVDHLGLARSELRIYEDPRLREQDRGYLSEESQLWARRIHGWFYYRHSGGESPADCYDRISSFLESLVRQIKRTDSEQVLIVAHGMLIRCFVMRFLHLSVEQFEWMKDPTNGQLVEIGPVGGLQNSQFKTERWAASGLILR